MSELNAAPTLSDKQIRPADARARIAVDLGAESCRVSLLRWALEGPKIDLIHRIPNGPIHKGGALRWPIGSILQGIEEGLRKAAEVATEGVASIGIDGWAVDYVRLDKTGTALAEPFCYRDERTIVSKAKADSLASPEKCFQLAGAQPLRINTLYQLMADLEAGVDPHSSFLNLPEYVLYTLGARRVAEYTNATHTGLVDIHIGDWSDELANILGLSKEAFPPIVPAGEVVGALTGPLSSLPAFSNTQLIVPACHDTASAIAGIGTSLDGTAYICSGTWSLVGTLIDVPITSDEAMKAGFTNQGAAGGGYCFHTNVNGMWIFKQCMEAWRRNGRPLELPELISKAAQCRSFPGTIPVDAPPLLLDGDMPALINEQLSIAGHATIEDREGNEPIFARVIFESLATRYAQVLRNLEQMLDGSIKRIYILGGGSLNTLLTRLTAEKTGLPVETGNVESSTVGNFAVQLSSSEANGEVLRRENIQRWAERISERRCRP